LTIGGNDAGFGVIIENCLMGKRNYTRARCLEVIAEWENGVRGGLGTPQTLPVKPSKEEGIPSIPTKLPVVLSNIHASAPFARIRIPLYPRILDTRVNGNIPVGAWYRIENRAPRGMISVAATLERFAGLLNRTIQTTVEAWERAERVNAKVVPGTVNAFIPPPPAARHQLGDATPWVNGVVITSRQESFHPNCRGHIALAEPVVRNLGRVVPGGWAC